MVGSATAKLFSIIDTPVAELLAEDLNALISGDLVYEAARFDGVALRPDTSQLLSQNPSDPDEIQVLNRLLLEDAYRQGIPPLSIPDSQFPAAVYYAQRFVDRNNVETIRSTVENVNVRLSGGVNDFVVDSTFGGTTSVAGGTDTTITVGSSLTGLHAETLNRLAFIDGAVSLQAKNIVLDDSGNDQNTTATLDGDQVDGLMPGTVTLAADSITTKLGANDDTFHIPATATAQTFRLEAGGGYDTVYLGTGAGAEGGGTLDGLEGDLWIDGGSVLKGLDTLFLNDQDTLSPQIYTVTNDYDWTVATNDAYTTDTTTITRGGDVMTFPRFLYQSL